MAFGLNHYVIRVEFDNCVAILTYGGDVEIYRVDADGLEMFQGYAHDLV